MLFVSHDLATVKRLCHRVVWLNAGRVIADGDPEEVVSHYEQSAMASLGSEGRVRNDLGELTGARLLSSEGVELGGARATEDAYIAISFTIAHAGQRARCGVRLSADGSPRSTSVQREVVEYTRPGKYSALVKLPANLLAETLYTVKPSIIFDGEEERRLAIEGALSFRVHDADEVNSARGTYRELMLGVVRPMLEWSVSEISDTDDVMLGHTR